MNEWFEAICDLRSFLVNANFSEGICTVAVPVPVTALQYYFVVPVLMAVQEKPAAQEHWQKTKKIIRYLVDPRKHLGIYRCSKVHNITDKKNKLYKLYYKDSFESKC